MIKFHPAITGAIFGVIIWVIGPLVLMPMLTSGAGACGTANACGNAGTGGSAAMLMSLAIHLLYGLITGITFKMVAQKT